MKSKFILAGLAIAMTLVSETVMAQDQKFMRSSIYSVLVNSADQNTRLDQEAQTTDPTAYAEALQGSGISSLGEIPAMVFPNLVIPEQFNNHNLDILIVDFDQLANGISEDQAKEFRPKGRGAGKLLKAAAARTAWR
ncbi:MAG: hypothetical protein HDS13_01460 [Bacteroides sp.]|nr:hypothetical protein [Bacteroides sp.]